MGDVALSDGQSVEPNASERSESERRAVSGPFDTIGEVIRAQAGVRLEQTAIVGSQFAPLSYRELLIEIDAVGACLRGAGFDRDARIAIAVGNSAQAALMIVAILTCATAVPIDPKLTVTEVVRCLRILRPSAIVLLRASSSAARTAAEQSGLPIIEAKTAQAGKLGLQLDVPKIGSALPLDNPDPQAPAFILHTSGTTAEPNLVPFSHRNMLAVNERLQTWFELTSQDRCLTVSPVYYSHALTTTILPPLLTGGSIGFPANPTNVDLSEWLGDLKPTWYSAGPTLHLAVLEKAEQRPDVREMHSLRFISTAGAPLPGDVMGRLRAALGIPVLEHYGSSETAQIATNRPGPGLSKAGTCGIPWPGIVRIVGDDGAELAVGERGEVVIGGPSVTSGYLNAPELNGLAFTDGWFRTGDIGSLDHDGFLTLHGRKKEMINRGSEKISPQEIDRALMQHPDVAQAAACGVPHPRLGEDVAAAVILRAHARATPADLRDFLTQRLASYKVPRRIVIVDQLPKGLSGKVQRKRLSEIIGESSDPSSPLQTRVQADLLQLWKRILKTNQISLDDDFFEKGGDSLLAMEVSVELGRLVGETLPEDILFEAPTVRKLAARLARYGSKLVEGTPVLDVRAKRL